MKFGTAMIALAIFTALVSITIANTYIESSTKITSGSMYSNSHGPGSDETFAAYGDITRSEEVQQGGGSENRSITTSVVTTPGMESQSILIQKAKTGQTFTKQWWSGFKNLQSETELNIQTGSLIASYDSQGEGSLWITSRAYGDTWKPVTTSTEWLSGIIEASRHFAINRTVQNATDQEWLPCTSCEADVTGTDSFRAGTWIRQGQSPSGGIFQEVGRNVSSTGSTVPGAYPYS